MSLVEDPPWAKAKSRVSIDYIGISLIALTFACFQIMLDRGEDDDWFSSPFIRTFAILAAVGAATAVAWLLYTRKPVVDLRVFKDRNFALGSHRHRHASRCFCTAAPCWSRSLLNSTWVTRPCSRDW